MVVKCNNFYEQISGRKIQEGDCGAWTHFGSSEIEANYNKNNMAMIYEIN
jgi:hypothetical protein